MMKKMSVPALLVLFFAAFSSTAEQPRADVILVNGKIFTSSPAQPYVEAVAIKGERILAIGTSQQIGALSGSQTKRIDLGGHVVIPGINDAHYHLFSGLKGVELHFNSQEPTWQEVTSAIAKTVPSTPKGTLVFGDTGALVFETKEANRDSLDKLAPDHPVLLSGWTGHYYIVNSAAMQKLGLKGDEANPLGGRYVRDANGRFTGVTLEYATFRLHRTLNSLVSEEDALNDTRKFLSDAARLGITSVQNMSAPIGPERLVSLLTKAPTPLRMRVMHFVLTDEHRRITEEGSTLPHSPSPLVTVSGTKYILDGTPIERTCAMDHPYADDPSTSGWMDFSEKDMEAILREALQSNDQLLVHIVGDRSVKTFLDAMDATGGKAIWSKRRVRIEHGDGITPDLVGRVRDLGIVVVQNPVHFTLRDLLIRRFGPETTQRLQPFRSLLDAEIPVAIGSDGPNNPYLNLMFASNVPGRPQESMTREQAIVAYTLTSAYAEFAEKDKGSLEPGKLADLAVLSQDIFHVEAQELPNTESLLTMVGGKIVYDAKKVSAQ